MKSPRRLLKRFAQIAAFVICMLIAIISLNVWRFESRQLDVAAVPVLDLPEKIMIERFAKAIKFRTVSEQNPNRIDADEFSRFRSYLEDSFPTVHENLHRLTSEDFGDDGNLSLLYKWKGKHEDLDSVLLMAHYDVVPAAQASLDRWTHLPFTGHYDDQYVWGRGALDVKNGVVALMEAIDHLLKRGFEPKQTVYISLGHDEEIGGVHGNKQISEWMQSQGIRLEFALDEGGCIFNDFPGCNQPVALVGIAEKGYVSIRLIVELETGGHSSMPPKLTAIGVLAKALHRLDEHQFPQRLDAGAGLTLDYVGPEMSLGSRIAMSNRWLFAPLVKELMGGSTAGNASIRTTMVSTMLEAGVKENVLPTRAEATVNVRILPGDSVESVLDHIKRVVSDKRVALEPLETMKPPSRISSTKSRAFGLIHKTIKQVFPNAIAAPNLVIAATDSSHFDHDHLSKDVYRFIPAPLSSEDLERIHGIDERISRSDYLNIVRFYVQLLKNLNGP